MRYAGWYSNRSRGKRRRNDAQPAEIIVREAGVREAACVRSTWARLIHKVYEVDPPGPAAPILTYHPIPDIA